MEPITLEEIAKAVADLVYKDIALLHREILENRDQIILLHTKLNTLLDNKSTVVPIIGKFLQLLWMHLYLYMWFNIYPIV